MKHSQTIGVIAALALIGVCFLPWVYLPNLNITLSGLNGKVNENGTFGTQWKPHTFFCVTMMVLFCIQTVWAKRTNLFIGFANLGWAIKNYIIFTLCRPECPVVKPSLYILVALAILLQVCTFLPKLTIKSKA
jgi:hypothetical protein